MASASTSTATPEPDKSAPSATTTAATTADDLLLEDNITNDTAPAELTAVVDSLLESLTHKFSSVSHEIFTKMDEMSNRLDRLEEVLQLGDDDGKNKK